MTTRRIAVLALLFAAAAAPACGLLDPDSGTQGELEDQMDKWAAQGPASYEYVQTQLCFCHPDYTQPYRIRVQAGKVVDARNAATGAPTPAQYKARTVPELFAVIEDALDREADQIDVAYDPDLGYPTSIVIDYERQAADEELTLEAEGLVALAQ
jgi:hypothetical protein